MQPWVTNVVLIVIARGVSSSSCSATSRKRKRDAEELQTKIVPGAEVMTQHGIYGTLISIDDEKNEADIETTPGTKLRVHRQTLAPRRRARSTEPGRRRRRLADRRRRRSTITRHSTASRVRRARRRRQAERAPRKKPTSSTTLVLPAHPRARLRATRAVGVSADGPTESRAAAWHESTPVRKA